jgi:hypothetical protein
MHSQCKIVLYDYPIKIINLSCHIKKGVKWSGVEENMVVIG